MYIYIKFGSERNMTDLLCNGTIYCNPISHFTKKELKKISDGRYDFNELVTLMEYRENSIMTIAPLNNPSKKINLKLTRSHYKEYRLEPTGNLYCLFALEPSKYKKESWNILDERLRGFGTHYIILKNSEEFATRVRKRLAELSIDFQSHKVEYIDYSKYSGTKNIFQKGIEYAYQNEFRLLLNTRLNIPYSFSIGNIEDIAEMKSSEHLRVMFSNPKKTNQEH